MTKLFNIEYDISPDTGLLYFNHNNILASSINGIELINYEGVVYDLNWKRT
jgi:hypothetical protein